MSFRRGVDKFERYIGIIWNPAIPFPKRKSRKTRSITLKNNFKNHKFYRGSLKWDFCPNETFNKNVWLELELRLVPRNTPVFEIWKSTQKWPRYLQFNGQKLKLIFSGKMHVSGGDFYFIWIIFQRPLNLHKSNLDIFQLPLRLGHSGVFVLLS